jgi:phosphoketolase
LETGHAGHVSSEHPTVTEMLAASGRAENALEQHALEALMGVYAKTYNYGTQLAFVSYEFFLRKLHKLH